MTRCINQTPNIDQSCNYQGANELYKQSLITTTSTFNFMIINEDRENATSEIWVIQFTNTNTNRGDHGDWIVHRVQKHPAPRVQPVFFQNCKTPGPIPCVYLWHKVHDVHVRGAGSDHCHSTSCDNVLYITVQFLTNTCVYYCTWRGYVPNITWWWRTDKCYCYVHGSGPH